MKLPFKAEDPVTWKAILFLLASFAAFMLTAMALAVARAEDKVGALEAKVEDQKTYTDAGIGEVRKDVKAIYDFLLTRERQPRLEAASK
jgi:hypothetical protein